MESPHTEGAAEELPLTSTLIKKLKAALKALHHSPYPHVPNPPTCKKRASVALIIRVRPTFLYPASYDSSKCGVAAGSFQERLINFFAQDWVKQGDPEVFFIKRAARQGDRWTGHVAFPDGKREPDDLDDHYTSVRETREAGLDLDVDHFLMVGNLAERVEKTYLGKVPYVYSK